LFSLVETLLVERAVGSHDQSGLGR
jgi:hypothetical protein